MEGRAATKGRAFIGNWIWGEGTTELMRALRRAYFDSMAIIAGVEDASASVKVDKRLTREGQRDALENAVRTHASAIARSRTIIQGARRDLAEQRESLRPGPADKQDTVGALRRQELRTWLRGLSIEGRADALSDPSPELVQAIVEQPAALSGVNAAVYQRMLNEAVEHAHPGAAEAGKQAAEALDTTARAVAAAEAAVRIAGGILPSAFDSWLMQHATDSVRPVLLNQDGRWMKVTRSRNDLTGGDAFAVVPATTRELLEGYRKSDDESIEVAFMRAQAA